MPATSLDRQEQVPISRHIETLRRYNVQTLAKERWQRFLPGNLEHAPNWGVDFPDELDLMGRTHGQTSLVGVVHVDGNGVGQAIAAWVDRCLDKGLADEQIRVQYREWSGAIDELGEKVQRATIRRVACCIFEEENERGERRCFIRGTPYELGFRLREDAVSPGSRMVMLPLRPILLGGDDLTFVCDGRIALDLAAAALREFEAHPIPYIDQNGGEKTLTACAGVALMKAHAPFHRGYELAAGLCASSKRVRLCENQQQHDDTGAWLDWHAGSRRSAETIEELRCREHQDRTLTMRPYPIAPCDGRDQSWGWLDTVLLGPGCTPEAAEQGFRGIECWAGSRSRVKRLGSLVPDGSDSIKRQVEAWNAIEDGVQLPAQLADGGFIGRRTPLLDAIELLDLHMRLEPDPRPVSDGSVGEGTA